MMMDCARILACRKAEDAAWRRFQAVAWLESLMGPLGISRNPSEKEFISSLRNGLILCNAINKVNPGAVQKVVESHAPLQLLAHDSQPLPAYQYFENVKNFLVAIEELKLFAFEASDLERDSLEAGSATRVVDCILALKLYHESKQKKGGNGPGKPVKSSPVLQPVTRSNFIMPISKDSHRRSDLTVTHEKKQQLPENVFRELVDVLVKLLAENVADSKENFNHNLPISSQIKNMDPRKLLGRIMSDLVKKLESNLPELESMLEGCQGSGEVVEPMAVVHVPPLQHSTATVKGACNHKHVLHFQMQERELLDLKELLASTKRDFDQLQWQLQRDLRELGVQVQQMSTDTLGYYKVLKENRSLYNIVQDLKGNIRVFCRIRPPMIPETNSVVDYVGEDGSLVILDPSKPGRRVFQFSRVFGPTSTQDEVYKDTQPLIRSVIDGYNVCIFAYGQTGSGKTHTMSGPAGGANKGVGINYLALSDLFHMSNGRRDTVRYDIRVQMVEIYNEQVRDLLAEDSSATRLEIRSCTGENKLSLPDAIMHSVAAIDDVLRLMKLGEMNRVVSSTAVNNRSSRSHSILTVHVHGKDISGGTLHGCLHLVDLAGSERVDKSEATGDRLKEAQCINKSLSCLGDVIAALAQRSSYVPYRNSKLTLLLQDSLGGHAKTLMFAHVSPEGDSHGESISTLKFAQRVSAVELGHACANKESSEIMLLKEQVETLKRALASKDAEDVQRCRANESALEKANPIPDCTPPRVRRLSSENRNATEPTKTVNLEEKQQAVSPSSAARRRRLSLEGPPPRHRGVTTERTPPRHRRPNNENGSNPKPEKAVNLEDRRGMKAQAAPTARPRRLSLENESDDASSERIIEEVVFKSYASSSLAKVSHADAPRSPTSSACSFQKQAPLPPMTETSKTSPVRCELFRNEVAQKTGRASQIRKSLRTIGKLINGTERRSHRALREEWSPIKGIYDVKDVVVVSPSASNLRALRRQSLTGIQTSGRDRSRRSSLGGKSLNGDADDCKRNARTPPPVHPSAKSARRWL